VRPGAVISVAIPESTTQPGGRPGTATGGTTGSGTGTVPDRAGGELPPVDRPTALTGAYLAAALALPDGIGAGPGLRVLRWTTLRRITIVEAEGIHAK
jgi:hypothetical protein